MTDTALLVLEDGNVFRGHSIGAPGSRVGEVVFNTAMTGYQEILTDPSYARQLVTLTFPQIGNTGCNPADAESDRVHAAGLVIRDASRIASNWRSSETLPDWLRRQDVVAIAGVDTRRLTNLLRSTGAQNGCLVAGATGAGVVESALAQARAFPGLKGMDLAREVSTAQAYDWTEGSLDLNSGTFAAPPARLRVVAYDFGVKRNILRLLVDRGCALTVVPAQTPVSEVLAMAPDGVFLSNGPGDPEPCRYAIDAIAALLEQRVPVFGICLGHQLLALAAGARTIKMKFGHHGANHPVQDLATGKVMISSQNHGFAVDEASLPGNVRVSHRSLFDGSNQGIVLNDAPAFSFQGHPEASPGPHDVEGLFDRFIELMRSHAPGTGDRGPGTGDRGPGAGGRGPGTGDRGPGTGDRGPGGAALSASHFRELDVWKAAMELAKAVYRMTAEFPTEERYGLTRQLQRAAVSIPSNIAEGNARQSTAEYARFVTFASGSLAELITQLQLAAELGLAKQGQAEPVQELAESVGRMLYRLHQALLVRIKSRSPVPGPGSPSPTPGRRSPSPESTEGA